MRLWSDTEGPCDDRRVSDPVPFLQPLAGGHSGRTFVAEAVGERSVVRVYPPGDARGPCAPELDEAVLRLVRGLVPVPDVLEVRREDAAAGSPGVLVTAWVAGERGDLAVARLAGERDRPGLVRLGRAMGRTAATLAGMPMLRAIAANAPANCSQYPTRTSKRKLSRSETPWPRSTAMS